MQEALEESCDVLYFGNCNAKFITIIAGGSSDCDRFLFVPVPNSQAKVTRDLLPSRIGGPPQKEENRADWSMHWGQARRGSLIENQANWVG